MVVIGEDRAERLGVIPAQFRVLVTRRPKLACRSCSGVVVQPSVMARLIAGGIRTEATVAHVLVARSADRGVISDATIAALEERGLEYVLGTRERTERMVREVVLADQRPYTPLCLERAGGEETPLAERRSSGIRHTRMGGLVQQPPPPLAHWQYSTL